MPHALSNNATTQDGPPLLTPRRSNACLWTQPRGPSLGKWICESPWIIFQGLTLRKNLSGFRGGFQTYGNGGSTSEVPGDPGCYDGSSW